MNILFISYWGLDEGLTQSTVIPHIKILSEYEIVNKIFLITIERDFISQFEDTASKIKHIPIRSYYSSIPLIGKILDFIKIPKKLKQYCTDYQIDKIIARGSPAGALAYLTWKKIKIPFFVESFEPHADYMRETGVWKKWNLKYIFQKIWENKQCQTAKGIMTVAEGYTNYLKIRYPQNLNVLTVPCAVDSTRFKYSYKDRFTIRKELVIDDYQIIGIYTGKFGGLYFDIKDLRILSDIFKYYTNLGLIFLTPTPEVDIRKKLQPLKNHLNKIMIKKVSYNDVPKYLSASDFGLSLNKQFVSGKYLSPIKIGEYWANGLPVLMTEGIGDEREFLEKERGGVFFNLSNIPATLQKLEDLIKDPDHRTRIPVLAKKYRSFNTVREAYKKLILPEIIDQSEKSKG